MTDLSISKVLVGAAASAAALDAAATVDAASSGNQDRPREGRINAKSPTSLNGPGPQSRTLAGQFPSFQNSPATHVNGMPLCWTSFSNAHRHYQNGGWAGEVTQDDFAIAEDISGVSVCLAANGVREIHWHEQAKWAIHGRRKGSLHDSEDCCSQRGIVVSCETIRRCCNKSARFVSQRCVLLAIAS